jgi:acyl-CoA thioesterase-1
MVSVRFPEGSRRVSPQSWIRGAVIALVYLTLAAGATAETKEPLVVFLGDSLTAGYGLAADESFPALVARSLREHGRPIHMVNAGVSGDTTTGALNRLGYVLEQKPDVLVVGLGANDAFRGQPVESIEANLRSIVAKAKAAHARVVLLGMRVPTNFGPDYTDAFHEMYARVAKVEKVDLMPFLLEGVGGHAELNLEDGVHPNREGQKIVAANVLKFVERALKASP